MFKITTSKPSIERLTTISWLYTLLGELLESWSCDQFDFQMLAQSIVALKLNIDFRRGVCLTLNNPNIYAYPQELVGPICVHSAHGLVLQDPAAVPVHFLIRSLTAMCSSSAHCTHNHFSSVSCQQSSRSPSPLHPVVDLAGPPAQEMLQWRR